MIHVEVSAMENYLSNLTDFLLSPLPASLLAVHPNEAALDVFPGWDNWWNWAAVDRNPLQALLDQYLVRWASTPRDRLPTILVNERPRCCTR